MSMKIALLGSACFGKSTFGKKLAKHWCIPCICTGDLIRKHMSDGTQLGMEFAEQISKGKLLPDHISTSMTYDAIQNYESFILDGYPRTIKAAQIWNQYETKRFNYIIHLYMDRNILIQRFNARLTCSNSDCNAVYNTTSINTHHHKLKAIKPITDNICDLCHSHLYKRSDDEYKVLLDRIHSHNELIGPILHYYKDQNIPIIDFEIKNGISDFDKLLDCINIEINKNNLKTF